eukprot:CAMPEP_0114559712 /NCGR_PEP_ID=MMETSP0114-20121206/11067_1 /TAXON_ID=31324 /ORGANISM="Goniomonas sp, Strain m" /LENGTH=164 /DNA_ID=CAMNT_0001745199 /DNA_START=851 /DNA_END=1345 /DNA_ORIENTATION=-
MASVMADPTNPPKKNNSPASQFDRLTPAMLECSSSCCSQLPYSDWRRFMSVAIRRSWAVVLRSSSAVLLAASSSAVLLKGHVSVDHEQFPRRSEPQDVQNGPSTLPGMHLFVVAHQPQPSSSMQDSQEVIALQSFPMLMGQVSTIWNFGLTQLQWSVTIGQASK